MQVQAAPFPLLPPSPLCEKLLQIPTYPPPPPPSLLPNQLESISEPSLELLIDDADDLISQEREIYEALARITGSEDLAATAAKIATLDCANPGDSHGRGLQGMPTPELLHQMKDEAQKRTISVCHALAAHEQDLFLAFAAILRLARVTGVTGCGEEVAAAVATEGVTGYGSTGDRVTPNGGRHHQPVPVSQHVVLQVHPGGASPAGAPPPGDDSSGVTSQRVTSQRAQRGAAAAQQQQQAAGGGGEGQQQGLMAQDKIVRELCEWMGGWLVHPLGEACPAAKEAAATFLWYLVVEDRGYR